MNAAPVQPDTLLYVELKPNIHTAQIVIKSKDCRNIQLKDDKISVELASAATPVTFDLNGISHKLRAGTCAGLQKKSGGLEIHFRLQTKSAAMPASVCYANETISLLDSVREARIASCSRCSTEIFMPSRFTRMLDLPSEGWADMADAWFCHNHDGCAGKGPTRILPRDNELLVGEYYVLLNRAVLAETIVIDKKANAIHCRRCCSWLGEAVEGVVTGVKLCVANLKFDYSGERPSCHFNWSPESCFLSWITSHSRRHASFRFVIVHQVAGKPEPYILLWLIDTELQLLFGTRNGKLRQCRGKKILYMACPCTESRLPEQWKVDSAAHTIELPSKMCVKLLSALKLSTAQMPASLVKIGDFFVGFLAHHELGQVDRSDEQPLQVQNEGHVIKER